MNIWWSIVVVCGLLELLAFAIAAAKGFTIGKTLRLVGWAWLHPWQAMFGELPQDFR